MANLLKKRKLHPSFLEIVFSFPKTILFNFKILPFKKAIKLPFFVSCHAKIIGVNKKTFICNLPDVHFGMCWIGIAGSSHGYLSKKKSLVLIKNGGKIVVNGVVGLCRGIFLECDNGVVTFGNNVKLNNDCYIECVNGNVSIGDNTSFGWNCSIKNYDGHHIIADGVEQANSGDILIGNHCWICSNATLLKNSYLGDDCVLAYGSLLTKKISEENNLLYAGTPAKIIKRNISWEK